MSFVTTEITLASAVADDGTVTVPYPSGTAQADFTGANASADGVAILNDNEVINEADSDSIDLSYGASNITLTNETGVTWLAGTRVRLQLGQAGADRPGFEPGPAIADTADADLDTSDTYADADVNAEIQTVIDKQNLILRALRDAGIIASA